jgi:hypothetical protein
MREGVGTRAPPALHDLPRGLPHVLPGLLGFAPRTLRPPGRAVRREGSRGVPVRSGGVRVAPPAKGLRHGRHPPAGPALQREHRGDRPPCRGRVLRACGRRHARRSSGRTRRADRPLVRQQWDAGSLPAPGTSARGATEADGARRARRPSANGGAARREPDPSLPPRRRARPPLAGDPASGPRAQAPTPRPPRRARPRRSPRRRAGAG